MEMVFVWGLGWILAAFLGGLLLAGRVLRTSGQAAQGEATGKERPDRKAEGRKGAPAGKPKEAVSEEQRRRAEQAIQEWQNFLTYDGTEQTGR